VTRWGGRGRLGAWGDQVGHWPCLEGEARDEPRRLVSHEVGNAASLIVLGHSDLANASVQIDSRVAARRSDASVISARVKSSGVNIDSPGSRRCPAAIQMRVVLQ
jgi:hypothetical protein